ncbi:immediate early response gene 2 protein [Hemicordylus capensis]|uniref:immediate early response gene 2 protein n=1 Tax=Hemicordylus capensis TaxID=884348 RepID=UPI002302444E|nr:immediate early response gene 2 protein [Hemicordylus capensis]
MRAGRGPAQSQRRAPRESFACKNNKKEGRKEKRAPCVGARAPLSPLRRESARFSLSDRCSLAESKSSNRAKTGPAIMEVQKEAQRIMTMSVWKMYHSRMQRGGLRLHRSLQLSLVMRNARDLYLSAKLEEEDEMAGNGGAAEDFAGRQPQPDIEEGEVAAPQHLEGPPATPLPPQLEVLPPTPLPLEAQQPPPLACPDPEPMETQEQPSSSPAPPSCQSPWSRGASGPPPGAEKPSRKRRSSSLGKIGAAEAGLVPSKKAKLAEEEGERQPQRQEGPFPGLARVLQDRFSGLILQSPPAKGADEPKASCRQGDGVLSIVVRAVVAF